MGALTKGSKIDAAVFKNRLKEIIDGVVPTGGWSSSNYPDSQMAFMLTTRDDIVNAAKNIVTNDTTITSNTLITATKVFNLIRSVFVELGRCRRIYYHNAQDNPGPGTQNSPSTIADSVGATSGGGVFAYFTKSFSFSGNYASPAAEPATNKDVQGYKTYPEKGTNNWHTNTTRATGTAQISSMSVNNLIKAVENVEQQMTNFKTEWTTRNNASGWWSGSASDSANTSNRIFFVRYWCHTNCHSNHHQRNRR